VDPVRSHRDLVVWQKAMDLTVVVYGLAQRFPRAEQYGLVSQITRSAVSVPANIAEGNGRRGSRREYSHYLGIARGSLMETETHVMLAQRLGFVNEEEAARVLSLIDEVSRMITTMRTRLEKECCSLFPLSSFLFPLSSRQR
jgi:four helix bundle protein